MPIHDWTRVEAGDFHHFHQTWIPLIATALNRGLLPPEFMALAEQITGRPIPDVVTLQTRQQQSGPGGMAVLETPPTARVVKKFEQNNYAKRADHIVIRHGRGKVVAIIEIMSPGNKSSRNAIDAFVKKASEILNQGIHLLIVDMFPPTPRDPQGIHKAISDEFEDEPFDFLPDKPLTVASYIGGDAPIAYVDSLGVGDVLPAPALFLSDSYYIRAPLESTYMDAWDAYPTLLKEIIETPRTF